jgi:hypothetical protein
MKRTSRGKTVSEFLEQVRRIRLDGKPHKIAIPGGMVAIDVAAQDSWLSTRMPYATRYTIKVEVGASVMLNHAMNDDPAAKAIQANIAEIVYGDVRRTINSMWGDVYKLRDDPKTWELAERIAGKLHKIIDEITP